MNRRSFLGLPLLGLTQDTKQQKNPLLLDLSSDHLDINYRQDPMEVSYVSKEGVRETLTFTLKEFWNIIKTLKQFN